MRDILLGSSSLCLAAADRLPYDAPKGPGRTSIRRSSTRPVGWRATGRTGCR